jgi:uncharacterized membrane protein
MVLLVSLIGNVELHSQALLAAMTKEERLIIVTGLLMGVLLLGAVIIAKVDRWRKRQLFEQEETATHIGSFRDMYENGEITKEEYDRLLRKMSEKAGLKVKPTPKPTSEAIPPTPNVGNAGGETTGDTERTN